MNTEILELMREKIETDEMNGCFNEDEEECYDFDDEE